MGLDGEMEASAWTVVLPVKALASAKSRLADGSTDAGELAFAFFRDALTAVLGASSVGEVLVATTDRRVSAAAVAAGATVVDDTGHVGINAAARWASQQRSGAGGTAVMVSDLPCITSSAVDAALALAGGHATSFLADLDGDGTTMWCAAPGHEVDSSFGVESRRAHAHAGAVDLVDHHPDAASALLPARCDVDTEAALARAEQLGLGPATRAVLDASHATAP
jgi:2-phospho-L-lactate/phosphoenolpyruvate guanylyltransferase